VPCSRKLSIVQHKRGLSKQERQRPVSLVARRWQSGTRRRPAQAMARPTARASVEACLRDMGWSVNPEPLIHPELTRGTLIDIRPGVTLSLPLYWQRWRLSSPTLALLSREVIAGVANVLETAPRRGPAVRGQ
jgi:hypothetical protein